MIDGSWDAPGDLQEQLFGIGIEDILMDADLFESLADVRRAKLRRPGCQLQAEAHAREQRPVDSHVQSWHQGSVADKQQTEGRLGIEAITGQQA